MFHIKLQFSSVSAQAKQRYSITNGIFYLLRGNCDQNTDSLHKGIHILWMGTVSRAIIRSHLSFSLQLVVTNATLTFYFMFSSKHVIRYPKISVNALYFKQNLRSLCQSKSTKKFRKCFSCFARTLRTLIIFINFSWLSQQPLKYNSS